MKQAEMLKEKGYITAAEAAQRFGRHVSSVYRLVESGKVEGLHIGRSWYVSLASLVAYANRENPRAAEVLGLITK